ncbi:hypothetical protein ABGB14_31500 [Nonomuraea sp. B10E15]|uniref:hypothetical protein n=1 Tax=Nonomuraea sp. B10E15 TaxID=3153560 RepID=UPI00325E4ED4
MAFAVAPYCLMLGALPFWVKYFTYPDYPALGPALLVLLSLGLSFGAMGLVKLWFSAWLQGTRLAVQVFRTHRCDLASANVSVIQVRHLRSLCPALVAVDSDTEQRVVVKLRRDLSLIPNPQLLALAAAIEHGDRSVPAAEQAQRVADGLRSLADNPLRDIL